MAALYGSEAAWQRCMALKFEYLRAVRYTKYGTQANLHSLASDRASVQIFTLSNVMCGLSW